ncbi:MAG: hypothetical protein ACXWQO_16160 [Bdellovibrionota bacterium]
MKNLLIVSLFLFAMPAFAEEQACPSDGEQLVKSISSQGSCYEAAKLARACAWGSSFDVRVAGAAIEVCAKDYKKISSKDKQVITYMNNKCNAKFEKMQGTMYISMNMFCQLATAEFWSDVSTPAE